MRVSAVIVTYNRKELISQNIDMLLAQKYPLDSIIVVNNNSTDGTEELLAERYREIGNIDYYKLPENIGGAGGFEAGTRRAFESGFDFIWLMDDDGRPKDENTLGTIMEYIENNSLAGEPIFLNSMVLCNDDELSFQLFTPNDKLEDVLSKAENGAIMDKVNPFNGTMISKELVASIGMPNGKFFIKGDDKDYQTRAIRSGATVATIVDSLYFHPKLPREYVFFLGKKLSTSNEAPWKEYYRIRNYSYMMNRDESKKVAREFFLKSLFIMYISKRENKGICGKMMREAYLDGINGRMGKTVNPGDTKVQR